MDGRGIVIAGALLATLNGNPAGFAQVQSPAGATAPITAEERQVVERSVLSDPRIRAIVGEGQPRITTTDVQFDKAEAEAFLMGTSSTPPTRRVTVVLINPQTQQAARALIEPSRNRVLSVESIAATDVPFRQMR